METPIYLFTGLLESGKTTLIQEVVREEGFLEPGKTVLIQCEEGEEEFSVKFLDEFSITLIKAEEPEELNEMLWKRLEKEHAPAQVMIEYNGMWDMETFAESGLPADWFIGGVYSTVNAETAEIYMNNMRKTFMEPLKASNLVIFNRCDDDTDRLRFRRAIKVMNPQVQVVFENKDGTLFQNEAELIPFDYSGPVIKIDDMDYGIWYLDVMEHPERYMGKEIQFTAKYCAGSDPDSKVFVPGRHVMTCCEADIQFLGYICDFENVKDNHFQHEDWVKVSVRFGYGPHEMYGYGDQGPVLELISIEAAEKPEQEMVTFT